MAYKLGRGIWIAVLLILLPSSLAQASMEIWDTSEFGQIVVEQTVQFYCNFSTPNTSDAGYCYFNINDTVTNMTFDGILYTYSTVFNIPGAYPYEITCQDMNATLSGNGSLLVMATDADMDGYPSDVDCDDSNPEIHPGMTEILYNGLDDDCNVLTMDILWLDLTLSKNNTLPGETIRVTINGTNGSDTYLTLHTPTNVSYIYIFDNGSYPVTQEFSLTTTSGTYEIEAVNYFQNYSVPAFAQFMVDNTFNAEIILDQDEAYENEVVRFKAEFSGAIGTVNVVWKMGDNNERYVHEFDYNYTYAREYDVVLIATDQGGNQIVKTRKVKIIPQYYLKIKVVNDVTSEIIPDAEIQLNNLDKYVNDSGEYEFKVTNKTYELRVSADDYYTYKEDIKINTSLFFTVRLRQDVSGLPPVITVISPENNTEESSLQIKFRVSDEGNVNCTIYVSEGDGWWSEGQLLENIPPNTEQSINLDLEEGIYLWKIECKDSDNNIAQTKELSSIIRQYLESVTVGQETTLTIIQNIYDLIPDFETYSPDEKRIAEYLNLEMIVKDAQRKLEMANRDLYGLRYESDPDSAIKKQDEIYTRIDLIKDTTPRTLRIQDTVDFVKYVNDMEAEEVLNDYFRIKGLEFTKKLIEQNILLQKKVTIQTKAFNVEIQYISGRVEDVTLIVRELDFDQAQNLNYVEQIPNDMITNTDQIEFVTKGFRIINQETMFEYSTEGITDVIYYVKSRLSLDKIPKIRSLIVTTELTKDSGVTGFTIFSDIGSSRNKIIFFVEIVIIGVLVIIYLYYRDSGSANNNVKTGSIVTKTSIISAEPVDISKIAYLRKVVREGNECLSNQNLKQAALKYHEAKFLYELMKEKDKSHVNHEIYQLSNMIILYHIEKLVEDAVYYLASGNKTAALELYDEIRKEYAKLSEESKRKIMGRCCDLALHLKKNEKEY